MSEIVTVIATFEPKPSRTDDFIGLMQSMVDSSRSEPGCLRYDFYEGDEGRFYMVEDYRDSDAVQAHRETPHYRDYRATVVDMLDAPISVAVLRPVVAE